MKVGKPEEPRQYTAAYIDVLDARIRYRHVLFPDDSRLLPEYDNEILALNAERLEISKKVPILHKADVIDLSVRQYCHTARMNFEKCKDFDSKRQFLLEYVEKIVYQNEDVAIYASVPIQDGRDESEQSKIEFRILGKITTKDRTGKYLKYGIGVKNITLPQYNGFQK